LPGAQVTAPQVQDAERLADAPKTHNRIEKISSMRPQNPARPSWFDRVVWNSIRFVQQILPKPAIQPKTG